MIAGICVELLRIFHWQFCFNILARISSGPDALFDFMDSSCFIMSFIPMSNFRIEGNCGGPLLGMGELFFGEN